MPARIGAIARSSAARRLGGVADALDMTRAECARLRDGRQTQTVTLHQLDDALALVASDLHRALHSPADCHAQLAGLRANVEIMVDIASALAIERGDGPSADVLLWAHELTSSIEAHRQDLAQPVECDLGPA